MNKEQWKNEVLQSLEGLARAQAPEQLFDQILQRKAAGLTVVKRPYVAAAAAALALLVFANFKALNNMQAASPDAAAYYQVEGADFGLYNVESVSEKK